MSKHCGGCGQTKSLTEFNRNRTKTDGFATQCRECMKVYRRENRAQIRESENRYWSANRERKQAKARRDYERHRDSYRERARVWYAANTERARENVRRYQSAHPLYYLLRAKARKRLLTAPDADHRDYVAILRADPCSYCGGPCEEIDHIAAVKAGGGNTWDNLTAACLSCNRAKATKPLLRALAGL